MKPPHFRRPHIGIARHPGAVQARSLEGTRRLDEWPPDELIAGNVKSAIALLESMLQKEPDYPPAMARIAAAYFIERRKEEGRNYLERLHRKGFDCSSVLAEQSKAFFSQNRIDQALALIDAAIETNHVSPEISELLAACTRLKHGSRSTPADGGACRTA